MESALPLQGSVRLRFFSLLSGEGPCAAGDAAAVADDIGSRQIAQLLIEREVITSEDVEHILGPRPWKSRGDELLEVNAALAEAEKPKKKTRKKKDTNEKDPA